MRVFENSFLDIVLVFAILILLTPNEGKSNKNSSSKKERALITFSSGMKLEKISLTLKDLFKR
ncbi:MAG: hypothetical protein HQM10_23665 [Candidatus Riflebacteria bacterium]|nr:hypothetical protein [Candidatus Riflebacteria bacterium]